MALKRERSSNESQGLCKLAIDEDLSIYTIDLLKQELSEEIAVYDRFELNLSAVEEIDSSGIQLLLALKTELKEKKKEFKISAASGAVLNLMESYGISGHFNMEDAS